MTIDELEKQIKKIRSQKDETVSAICEAEKIIEEKEVEIEQILQLQSACQIVASSIQTIAHKKISAVVKKCLDAVFNGRYDFEILFDRKRGKTEASMIFKKNGNILSDPLRESGGGVMDVASFGLRLSALVLTKPKKRKVLFLDEPFKYVSKKYRKNIGKLLKELSTGYGVQIKMITHIDELKTGTIYKIGED